MLRDDDMELHTFRCLVAQSDSFMNESDDRAKAIVYRGPISFGDESAPKESVNETEDRPSQG